MTISEVKKQLARCFEEVGAMLELSEDETVDIDIREEIGDSLQFITAVLEIESTFDIILSEDLMLYDSLASFNAFAESIYSLWKEKHSETEENDKEDLDK